MAFKTNFEDLATFNTPQEILQAISDGVEDVADPKFNPATVMGINPNGNNKENIFEKVKAGLTGDYTNKEEVLKKQEVKNLHDMIGNDGIAKDIMNNKEYLRGGSFKPSDYTNMEEVLKKSDSEKWKNQEIYKKTHAGKIAISEGLIPKDKKYIPALKLEKTKINSVKLDKLDKMMEDIDKAANGKITTHKPVSTIMNLPKKERAEAVKKLGLKLRDNLNKLNETFKNNPGKLNFNPLEKVQLELFMAKMNRKGGPDKFVEQNFKLTQDELKQGKTKEDQIREEVLKENKVKGDKESPKKESILKESKNENLKEATKAGPALKENRATVKTLDLKTTEKTSNDLVAKASDTKDVKPIMSGPTAPSAPTQNLNVGGRV